MAERSGAPQRGLGATRSRALSPLADEMPTAGARGVGVGTRLLRNPRVTVPGAILTIIILTAVFAPWIAPHDPYTMNTALQLQGPSLAHPFGTDEYGRDLMSRTVYGARSSLIIAATSVAVATALGMLFGVIGGYFGGIWEVMTMRTVDVLLTIPPILLAIAVVAFLGPSRINLIAVIGLLYMTRFARLSFASTVQIKQRDFVVAGRVIGARTPHIIRTAILPNILAPIFVQMSLSLGFAILLESGLSFLGLGTPPPEPTWGNLIGVGRGFMQQSVWYVLWPSLAISVTILCCNMLGDGLRDTLDPRLRQ